MPTETDRLFQQLMAGSEYDQIPYMGPYPVFNKPLLHGVTENIDPQLNSYGSYNMNTKRIKYPISYPAPRTVMHERAHSITPEDQSKRLEFITALLANNMYHVPKNARVRNQEMEDIAYSMENAVFPYGDNTSRGKKITNYNKLLELIQHYWGDDTRYIADQILPGEQLKRDQIKYTGMPLKMSIPKMKPVGDSIWDMIRPRK